MNTDAIQIFLEEHQSHRCLLDEIAEDRTRFEVLREELIHHVDMEEQVLYPNLLKVRSLELTVREAWEEHNLIMQLLQEMDDHDGDEVEWLSKFSTLKKLMLLHLEEEEEKLFPRIRKLASGEFLQEVGEQMLLQKELSETEEIIYPPSNGKKIKI